MYAKSNQYQKQGILYSIGLRLLAVSIYYASTYKPDIQSIDFDLGNGSTGFSRPKKHTQKKMTISDLEKKQMEDKSVPEKAVTETADSSDSEEFSEIDSAEDISFQSDAIAPRPITKLKKIYPEKARLQEVEAVAYLSVVIGSNGKILSVNVIGVKLKKKISPEVDNDLKRQFSIAARDIIKDVRFSPARIKGKKVPVIMDIPLNFTLN